MPTYQFACIACDIEVERYFTFNEEHRVECEKCGHAMVKVIQATPSHFKGGGWGGQ
jgi:putative FmdB family regulatory protein